MAVRRQDERRPKPDLEDPQWRSGTPARSVGELEATEQMGDSRQHDHDRQDGEQESRSDVATSTTAPVTIPVAPAASGSWRGGPSPPGPTGR
jgi:hypothetical protein